VIGLLFLLLIALVGAIISCLVLIFKKQMLMINLESWKANARYFQEKYRYEKQMRIYYQCRLDFQWAYLILTALATRLRKLDKKYIDTTKILNKLKDKIGARAITSTRIKALVERTYSLYDEFKIIPQLYNEAYADYRKYMNTRDYLKAQMVLNETKFLRDKISELDALLDGIKAELGENFICEE